MNVLEEIQAERVRQDAKWGEQNWPSVDSILQNREGGCTPLRMADEYEMPSEDRAKYLCEIAFKRGTGTYAHIAVEEVAEAICAKDDVERRKELVQCAAVFVAWIEAIDRKLNIEGDSDVRD